MAYFNIEFKGQPRKERKPQAVEFAYHWSPEYPRRKVHLSEDGSTALCGRDVNQIEVDNVGPLEPFLVQSAMAGGVFNIKPLCVQCYRRAWIALVGRDHPDYVAAYGQKDKST